MSLLTRRAYICTTLTGANLTEFHKPHFLEREKMTREPLDVRSNKRKPREKEQKEKNGKKENKENKENTHLEKG